MDYCERKLGSWLQMKKQHHSGKALAGQLQRVTLEDLRAFPAAAIEQISTLDRAQTVAVQARILCE